MQQAKSRYFINKIHNFIYLRLHSSTPFCFHVRQGGSRIVHATPAPPPCAVEPVRLRHDSAHPKSLTFAWLMCSDYDHDYAYLSKLSSDRLRTLTMSIRASTTSVRAPNQDVWALQQAVRVAWRAARLTPTTWRIDHREERCYNNHNHHHHDWSESSRARQFRCHRPVFCPKVSTLPIFIFNTISSNHSNMLTWRSISINIL
jgi:hypothetical protein